MNHLLVYYNGFRGASLLSFGIFAQLVGPKRALKLAGFRLDDLAKKNDDNDAKPPWVDQLTAALTARDVGLSVIHFAAAWTGDPLMGRVAAATTAAEILGILWGIPEATPTFVPILLLDVVAAATGMVLGFGA